jgi:hypothetical protein
MGKDNGGRGASDNDDVEDDNDGSRGEGPSLIHDEDGQVGGATAVEDNRMGCANHHLRLHNNNNWIGGGGGY